MDHPALGQAVAIYDDRSKTRLHVLFGVGLVVTGIMGVYMGRGDLAGGAGTLGWVYVSGGVFLALYGLRTIVRNAIRIRNPVALWIGRRGFEYAGGPGPIMWDEVEWVRDPASPSGEPRMLRVQLADPVGFAERHSLSAIARFAFRVNQGDLVLGRDMALPVGQLQSLMRKHLTEYRRGAAAPGSAAGSAPAASSAPAADSAADSGAVRRAAPRGRRPSRKR